MRIRFISKMVNYSIVILMFLTMTSCDDDDYVMPDYSDLSVHVSGTLSGKSRSGLIVTLYASREDAENEVNNISQILKTDVDGWVTFFDLEWGTRYWVRVDTTLIHNIKLSDHLMLGDNEMKMRIL